MLTLGALVGLIIIAVFLAGNIVLGFLSIITHEGTVITPEAKYEAINTEVVSSE